MRDRAHSQFGEKLDKITGKLELILAPVVEELKRGPSPIAVVQSIYVMCGRIAAIVMP